MEEGIQGGAVVNPREPCQDVGISQEDKEWYENPRRGGPLENSEDCESFLTVCLECRVPIEVL